MQAGVSPYDAFLTVMKQKNKAPDTIQSYQDALRLFCNHIKIKHPDELASMANDELKNAIKGYFMQVSHSRANIAMSAIHLFCRANEIVLPWDHISLFKQDRPEGGPEDKPYTVAQIQTLLAQSPNDRVSLAILTMCTAGLRVGALSGIAVKDLDYIDKYGIYAITVYPNTKAQYVTFLTPKSSDLMRKFVGNRQEFKPVFYNLFEPDLAATKSAHVVAIWRLLVKTGLRQPTTTIERKEIMMDHGFRKHYRTQLDASRMREDYAERLMDHGPKLVRTYAKPEPQVWLETSGYLAAIPYLTY